MNKVSNFLFIIISLFMFSALSSCADKEQLDDYLLLFNDTLSNECGYRNLKGDTIILQGKYEACFTDTFRNYAIVLTDKTGLVAINKEEAVLYHVFMMDNGPDYFSEGTFRITRSNKIGYADSSTGKIIIEPKFECAFPFEKGIAKVSMNCTEDHNDEHTTWLSDHWYYIDKSEKRVEESENLN